MYAGLHFSQETWVAVCQMFEWQEREGKRRGRRRKTAPLSLHAQLGTECKENCGGTERRRPWRRGCWCFCSAWFCWPAAQVGDAGVKLHSHTFVAAGGGGRTSLAFGFCESLAWFCSNFKFGIGWGEPLKAKLYLALSTIPAFLIHICTLQLEHWRSTCSEQPSHTPANLQHSDETILIAWAFLATSRAKRAAVAAANRSSNWLCCSVEGEGASVAAC